MPAIVPELVGMASDPAISTTDLLRKALVVARRLAQAELSEWFNNELNGYPNGVDLPEYRKLNGHLQAWNPFRGYIPFMPSPAWMVEKLSQTPLRQSIAELEKLAQSENGVHCSFPPELEQMLMQGMQVKMRPSVKIPTTAIQAIPEIVRNRILEWALDLEEKGIVGEGMTFTAVEKQMVQERHYHFENVTSSQIQIGTSESNQTQNNSNDISALKALIEVLGNGIERGDIAGDIRDELRAEIDTLKAQAASPKPKWQIIKATAGSIKSVLENATGSMIATQALPYLAPFLHV